MLATWQTISVLRNRNGNFTSQIQLDLISWSSIDIIHPRSSNPDSERSVSIQISRTPLGYIRATAYFSQSERLDYEISIISNVNLRSSVRAHLAW